MYNVRLYLYLYFAWKGIPNFDDMIDTAALIRDRVNEQVFVYAYSAALTQRKDARARGAVAPPIWEVFPEKFIGKFD